MKSLLIIFLSLSLNFYCANANNSFVKLTKIAKLRIVYKTLIKEIETDTLKTNANVEVNDCSAPIDLDYQALCADIGSKAKVSSRELKYYVYTFEKRILKLSCVNLEVDDEETIIRKVQSFWNKYKTKCKCDSLQFNLSNGNILKFAISQNMFIFIETIASYELDINFIDPADGLNLLDYTTKEIERLKKLTNSEGIVKIYEDYKAGVIGLGARPSKK